MNRSPLAAALTLVLLALAPAARAADSKVGRHDAAEAGPVSSFDGTTWKVTLVPERAAIDRGEKMIDDTLAFADGKMTSSACTSHGFDASAVASGGKSGRLHFTTTQESAKEGRTRWQARAKGNMLLGTMFWTRPDGSVTAYQFRGSQQK